LSRKIIGYFSRASLCGPASGVAGVWVAIWQAEASCAERLSVRQAASFAHGAKEFKTRAQARAGRWNCLACPLLKHVAAHNHHRSKAMFA
jgi:hypothetical protein